MGEGAASSTSSVKVKTQRGELEERFDWDWKRDAQPRVVAEARVLMRVERGTEGEKGRATERDATR